MYDYVVIGYEMYFCSLFKCLLISLTPWKRVAGKTSKPPENTSDEYIYLIDNKTATDLVLHESLNINITPMKRVAGKTSKPPENTTHKDIYIINNKTATDLVLHDCLNIKIHNCPRIQKLPRLDNFLLLESLSISHIDLAVFDISLPTTLLSLKVTYSGMKEFRPANIVQLAELDISFNKLKEIPPCIHGFKNANQAMSVYMGNNDFWFDAYSTLPDSMITQHTVQELIYANQCNVLSMNKLRYAINSLRVKRLFKEAMQLEEAVNVRLDELAGRYHQHQRDQNKESTTYANTQNVHLPSVQKSLRDSLLSILDYKPIRNDALQNDINVIASNLKLTRKVKNKLVKACTDQVTISINSNTEVTLRDILIHVYAICQDETDKEKQSSMMDILREEINDGIDICFTGKVTRIVNALNGFYKDVKVGISRNEEISNSIIAIRKKYATMYNNNIETYISECIPVVWQMLEDMCVPEVEALVWLEYV